MMEVHAGKSLDKILYDFNPDLVEEQKKMLSYPSEVAFLFTLFETLAKKYMDCAWRELPLPEVTTVVSPGIISAFVSALSLQPLTNYLFPFFANKLIQNSYDAGYNGFYLDLLEKSVPGDVASYLKGREHHELEITVSGHCGFWDAQGAECIKYQSDSKVGLGFAYGAKNSLFTFKACSENFGNTAEHCIFDIAEEGGYRCAKKVKHSIVIVRNIHNSSLRNFYGEMAVNSTFKTPNRYTLKNFESSVAPHNKIIFIEEDGTERIIRDCAEAP